MGRSGDSGGAGECGEWLELEGGWGGCGVLLEWFYFFLRGNRGSLWPKGEALSHDPTGAITQDDHITLYVRDPMAAREPQPCVNHTPTRPWDSLTLPAPIML